MTRKLNWTYGIGLLMALLAGFAEYNTVLTAFCQKGASVWDATIFATVMWRSGWGLHGPPLLDNYSFLTSHISPLLYVPDALSYLFPGDNITFCALVYAGVYAGLAFVACLLIAPLSPAPYTYFITPLAMVAFFCSQPVFGPTFEPHMEVASPLFGLLMFRAWQRQRYRQACLWLLVNAALREDMGTIYGVGIMIFAAARYLESRTDNPAQAKQALCYGILLFVIGVTCSAAAFGFQCMYFPGGHLWNGSQYFPSGHAFDQLDAGVFSERIKEIYTNGKGIWMPLVALLIAAILYKDWLLCAASIGFLPYWLINFISASGESAVMHGYKSFPFVIVLLMPALVAIVRPQAVRWKYMLLQWVVLVCSTITYVPNERFRMAQQWFPKPFTYNGKYYRDFEKELPPLLAAGGLRVSGPVEALYPYSVGYWYLVSLYNLKDKEADTVKTMIWLGDEHEDPTVMKLLSCYRFDVSDVPGTRLHVAKRKL